jgi:lipopolysaccharide export system permease protein
MTIVSRYIARQMLGPTLAAIAVLCGPVILIALLSQLPGPALRTSLAWLAIWGIVPTALNLTLPLAIGLGATWAFANLRADSVLHALFSIRVSVLALLRPVLLLGLPILLIGYLLSCVIAPRSVTQIQDVMFVIRNNLSVDLFHQQTFYTLEGGRYTLFFDRKLGDNTVGGVMFQESLPTGATNLIVAREARFQVRGGEQSIVFADGTLQSLGPGGSNPRSTTFDELSRPFGKEGTSEIPKRVWRGVFELDTGEFLATRTASLASNRTRRAWMTEAIKRFAIPLLTLAHPLAGIAIVLAWRGGRRNTSPYLLCAPVVLLHLAILFGAESVNYFGTWMAWLVPAVILAELAIPIAFLIRMQNRAV